MRRNPNSVRFEEIDSLLMGLDFARRWKGSHVTYLRPGRRPITVPFRKPFVLAVYVKAILTLLEEMEDSKMKQHDRGQAPSQRSVEEYLRLPYTIHVIRDELGGHPGFFARVLELSGCMTQADDFAELGDMVEDAMRAWIETAQEDGQTIPEPWPIELTAENSSCVCRVRCTGSLSRHLNTRG